MSRRSGRNRIGRVGVLRGWELSPKIPIFLEGGVEAAVLLVPKEADEENLFPLLLLDFRAARFYELCSELGIKGYFFYLGLERAVERFVSLADTLVMSEASPMRTALAFGSEEEAFAALYEQLQRRGAPKVCVVRQPQIGTLIEEWAPRLYPWWHEDLVAATKRRASLIPRGFVLETEKYGSGLEFRKAVVSKFSARAEP